MAGNGTQREAKSLDDLDSYDVDSLRRFRYNLQKMRNDLNHFYDLGREEMQRLKGLGEQWLVDDVGKALSLNRKTIDALAEIESGFVSVFKNTDVVK